MPTIKQSQQVDASRLEPVQGAAVSPNQSVPPPPSPFGVSPFFSHALPAISSGSDQYTRQFYGTAGTMPQRRSLPISVASASTGPKGDAGATGATGATLVQKIKTGILSRADIPLVAAFVGAATQATGNVHLGRVFDLLAVKAAAACRVRLYSTAALRTADVARDVNTPPTIYTAHGLIFDLNADATYIFPLTWQCSPTAPGADLNASAAGDIAYTVDSYGALSGTSFANNTTGSASGAYPSTFDVAIPVGVTGGGTLAVGDVCRVQLNPYGDGRDVTNTGSASFLPGGSIAAVLSPGVWSPMVKVPAGATAIHLTGVGPVGFVVQKVLDPTLAPITVTFTVLTEES